MLLLVVALALCSCTEQIRTRSLGGAMTMKVPAGQRLVNATWKGPDLWLLVRPLHEDERPDTYEFRESSSWGALEGKITLIESRIAEKVFLRWFRKKRGGWSERVAEAIRELKKRRRRGTWPTRRLRRRNARYSKAAPASYPPTAPSP